MNVNKTENRLNLELWGITVLRDWVEPAKEAENKRSLWDEKIQENVSQNNMMKVFKKE